MRPIRGKLGVSGSGTVNDQLDLSTVSGTVDVLRYIVVCEAAFNGP